MLGHRGLKWDCRTGNMSDLALWRGLGERETEPSAFHSQEIILQVIGGGVEW